MTTTKEQQFLLRDVFNPAAVEQLAHTIARVWPAFDRTEFVATINNQLDALSFGGRNALIRFVAAYGLEHLDLNDIAKDHPDLVVETLARWKQAGDPGTEWIIGHAARTLLKQGHPGALALLGYQAETAISAVSLQLNQTSVPMGEDLVFTVEIQSTADAPQDLMIDYVVHHRKANGKLAPKVFKLAKKRLDPRETLSLTKNHAFRLLSTRVYYPGHHALELQINGQRWSWQEFELVFEADMIVKS
jgi:hypothetical protein